MVVVASLVACVEEESSSLLPQPATASASATHNEMISIGPLLTAAILPIATQRLA